MDRRRRLWMMAAVVLLWGFASMVSAAGVSRKLVARLNAYPQGRSGKVGFAVTRLSTGKRVFGQNEDTWLVPASNQKLVTVAAAVERLGGAYSFRTQLRMQADTLRVMGGFDPLFGGSKCDATVSEDPLSVLDTWARAVSALRKNKPCKKLQMHLANGPESPHPPSWEARHLNHGYGAAVSSLNIHGNGYGVSFERAGGRLVPRILPMGRYVKLENRLRLGKKNLWRLRVGEQATKLTLTGTAGRVSSTPMMSPMTNPPAVFGLALADRLAAAKVKVTGPLEIVRDGQSDWGTLVAEHKTSIRDVVKVALQESVNLAAECLFLKCGDGTWAGASSGVKQGVQKQIGLPDAKAKGWVVSDGSGLSKTNRVSAAILTAVLTHLNRSEHIEWIVESLPKAGETGTLRRRMKGGAFRGRVVAKTGWLYGTVALSGYILDANGKPYYAFSLLLNGVKDSSAAKRLGDDLCGILVSECDLESK